MKRRDFIKSCIAMGLVFPNAQNTPFAHAHNLQPKHTKILIELEGGNDGLNTVIPYKDPLYKDLRPTLALEAGEVISLNNSLALHHSLEDLMPIWEKNQIKIVLGVGYEQPNLSHFRSIEIWNTASKSNEYLSNGWLAPNLNTLIKQQITGLVLGGSSGPLEGVDQAIHIRNIKRFIKKGRVGIHPTDLQGNNYNSGLQKIINTQRVIDEAAANIKVKIRPLKTPVEFKKNDFAQQAALATQIIQSDLNIPVIKLRLKNFDTHVNQKPKHANLLKILSESIYAMHQALNTSGHWENTTIMTYSEFGRRARENGSKGTDHGTAAPHFIIGGSIKGGFAGEQPNLSNLHKDNLQFTTDFKQLYQLALEN